MRITLETAKRVDPQKKNNSFMGFGTVRFDLTKLKFADVVLVQIFEKILRSLSSIEFTLKQGDSLLFTSFLRLFKKYRSKIFYDLYRQGFTVSVKDSSILNYVDPSNYRYDKGKDEVILGSGVAGEANIIYSDNYFLYEKSDAKIVEDMLKHIDTILNVTETATRKLGSIIVISPKQAEVTGGVILPEEKKEIEKEIETKYGNTDDKSSVLILSQSVDVMNIGIDLQRMQLSTRLQDAIKLIQGYFDVPYELLPISGQSTFSNRAEADKELYKVADRYAEYFVQIQNNVGLDVDFKNYNQKTEV